MRLVALLVTLLGTLVGCTGVRYLTQAAGGQLEILTGRRPLDEVVADPETPPHVRQLLAEVPTIKQFGETYGLKPTKSYGTYVDLRRPAVVWVVRARDPRSFAPRKWTVPIVGSGPYLGWFDREDAERHADELREEGLDVDVRPASAYSTLGWFEDPVLSTMIDDGPDALGALANVVLHESMHATHYVDGQTAFDETIANFVGDRLAIRYLDQTRGEDSAAKRLYMVREDRRRQRARALHQAYVELAHLYASSLSREAKLVHKRIILGRLRAETGSRRPINNATLFEFKSYNGGFEELDALLGACGGSFPRLIRALRRIGKSSFEEPQQRDLAKVIRPLVAANCPG